MAHNGADTMEAVYDPATGLGYDGLLGPSSFRVNMNSGSESTIEALMACTNPLPAGEGGRKAG